MPSPNSKRRACISLRCLQSLLTQSVGASAALLMMLGLALFSSNALTTSTLPAWHAKCSAVEPLLFVALTYALKSIEPAIDQQVCNHICGHCLSKNQKGTDLSWEPKPRNQPMKQAKPAMESTAAIEQSGHDFRYTY